MIDGAIIQILSSDGVDERKRVLDCFFAGVFLKLINN